MDPGLRQKLIEKCSRLDIPVVGFTPADRWDSPPFEPWVPETFRPKAIWPEVKTVMVIGIPVSLPVIETAPSIWYHELYRTVNTLLDTSAYRIAVSLTRAGHPSVAVPRDAYGSIAVLQETPVAFFSHRHAAYLAGLGTFGVNNVLLTPGYGPRIRFASIFTTAEILPDPILNKVLCTRCMRCVRACPVHAIGGSEYPAGITDKHACADRSAELAGRFCSPCGQCIRVCPVGHDRKAFDRENPGIYDGKDAAFAPHRRGWEHVRRYGVRNTSPHDPDTP